MANSIGINLFSVYRELYDDYAGTLERLSRIGYRNVELLSLNFETGVRFSELYPARDMRELLKRLELNPVAVHEMLPPDQHLPSYDWDAVIRYYEELGCDSVVVPWLWFNDRDETLRIAEHLDKIGRRFKENGLQLYYHNHGHEFRSVGEAGTLFDLLAENTEPEHLKFEFDLIWIVLAGVNPLAVMEKLGDRCDLTHQNDFSKLWHFDRGRFFADLEACGNGSGPLMDVYRAHTDMNGFTDLGEGAFDFASFYRKVNELGFVRCSIVENETSFPNKLDRVERDYRFMRQYV